MHYNLRYEINEYVSKLFTEVMLSLYDEYKDNEKIFPKENNKKQ